MKKSVNILGISAFYHDSAVCLLRDGKLIAAAQEERFTRKKHDESFPLKAAQYCLKEGGISIDEVDFVTFYDKPLLKFSRLLETYLAFAPSGITSFLKSMPLWLGSKLWMPELIKKELGYKGPVLFAEHHESHAASAFYASPYQEAAFLTIDGVGEWATTSFGIGKDNTIKILKEIHFPHSLGLLYSAITYYTGFKVNSGEYKIMGLAPYGEPKYVSTIYDHLIEIKDDGSFRLNMEYFDYCTGLTMTNEKFHKLFGGPPRIPETKLTQKEMDLARSVQDVTEDIMLRMARTVKKETGQRNLCLAGGVALNCVANGKLLRENIFDDIWIQPAAGDAGGAIGAAYLTYYRHLNNNREYFEKPDNQRGSYLGIGYSNSEIRSFLDSRQLPYTFLDDDTLINTVTEFLISGKIVGWFQGRMEFGPRALGNRSILGDPRNPDMQKTMNIKIKFREGFRPFAPSVLEEKISEWFEIDRPSPYMLLVADVKKEKQIPMTEEQKALWGIEKLNILRSEVPAITHVDYSARIQSVSKETNPRYYNLIKKFFEKTGCPILVNTSFNVRGEPIVCSPNDAYTCFMRTDIDVLVLNNYLLVKEEQPPFQENKDWRKEFVLD